MKFILMLVSLAALSESAAALESPSLLSSFNAAAALTRQAKENFPRPTSMLIAGSPAAHGPIVLRPGESPFAAFERLYKNSNTPANMMDFDEYAAPSTQQCVFAFSTSTSTRNTQIKRFVLRNEEKLVAWSWGDNPSYLYRQPFFGDSAWGHLKLDRTPTDLVIKVARSHSFLDSPVIVNIRKTGDMNFFQATSYSGQSRETTVYGYCYR